MATTLPPIVHTPFGKYFHQKPYIFTDLRGAFVAAENASSTSLASLATAGDPRPSSLSSIASVMSAPLQARNDENQTIHEEGNPPQSTKRAISLYDTGYSTHKTFVKANRLLGCTTTQRSGSAPQATPVTPKHDSVPYWNAGKAATERSEDLSSETFRAPRLEGLHTSRQTFVSSCDTGPPGLLAVTLQHADKQVGQFRYWASTLCRKRYSSPHTPPQPGRRHTSASLLGQDFPSSAGQDFSTTHNAHRKRLSNTSSGFVETIKTASLSNASLSMAPKSHRQTRSSETRGTRSSNIRISMESEQPIGRPSLDEAAFSRGLKRSQILQEILTSEETYLADLKALSNLFSTLLTSIAARSNIQRNLHEMLCLHTELVDELHRVALVDAPRNLKRDFSFRRSGVRGHVKRHSLQIASPLGMKRHTRHSRSSSDSVGPYHLLCTIEPRQAAEFAQTFKHFMARFFIYEEYCSNHEIMLQELAISQRALPCWPLYETGIEALTRSIRSINHQDGGNRKALTVGDLLMSPIQRLTKYPLLFADLHKSTPVIDCPDSQAEVALTLQCLCELVREVNQATDDHNAREKIRKRWALQDRLAFNHDMLQHSQFRMLGQPVLCGVLHLAYQTITQVKGGYGLCILFATHMVFAMPSRLSAKFDVIAVVHLSDLNVESTVDGKGMLRFAVDGYIELTKPGLQCHTAPHSWKLVFESDRQLFEIILSACSATEEEQWRLFIDMHKQTSNDQVIQLNTTSTGPPTIVISEFRSTGVAFGQAATLARQLSVQRAATVGNRTNVCQVIIKNTHKQQETQDSRSSRAESLSRSQSLLSTHKTTILAPKRSERIRLEHCLEDVWTRDKLPFPGMSGSRSGHIIRTSAGSLVRKLSFASMHGPFTRRSASITHPSHSMSNEALLEITLEANTRVEGQKDDNMNEVKVFDEAQMGMATMEDHFADQVVQVQTERLSLGGVDRLFRRGTKKSRRRSMATIDIPVAAEEALLEQDRVAEKLGGKKRWSNPLGLLRNFSTEGVRHILYSSK